MKLAKKLSSSVAICEADRRAGHHDDDLAAHAEVVSLIESGAGFILRKSCLRSPANFDLRAVPSVFHESGAAIFKHRVSEQDRLCRPIYLTDVHANAAGYERIVGQMRTL